MNTHNHITEGKIIDYILGNINGDEQIQIQHHISSCEQCQSGLKNWQQILEVKTANTVQPSSDAEEEIWRKLEEKNKKIRWKPSFSLGIGSLAAICILLLSVNLLKNTPEDPISIAENEAKQIELFINKPETQQLNVLTVSHEQPLNGNVWVNDMTQQMLVEIDGFTKLVNQDYQLWIIYTDNDTQGVIIPIQNGSAKMFMEDLDVNNFKLIKASVEPKGGSLLPTGPETFIVEFNK